MFGRDHALRVPALRGVQKAWPLPTFEPPHLHSVELPGAEIRMFRFMRDVEPEDPMFLM